MKFEEMIQAKHEKAAANEAAGKMIDCDYDDMIDAERANIDNVLTMSEVPR